MTSDYQKDLKEAKDQLAEMLISKELLETEIARRKRKIAALAELCNTAEDGEIEFADLDLGGLTDACITVLRGSRKEWLNTSEVQGALRELGFPIHTYKAPNASIATTLNRLAVNGYVLSDKKLGEGAIEYKWVGRYVVDTRKGPAPRSADHPLINLRDPSAPAPRAPIKK